MNITDYIAGSVRTAHQLAAEATLPKLRDGYTRTQELVDHIADAGPIKTAEICKALDLTSRQVWGMLKDPLQKGKVTHERGLWARTSHDVATWYAAIDETDRVAAEAEAVALLTSRGWTCIAPRAA